MKKMMILLRICVIMGVEAGGMNMGDILSQNEIDNLLAALSSMNDAEEFKRTNEKHIKIYDFARPSVLKEHLRTLNIIFEHYGRLLSLIFRHILGRMCK